VYAAGVFVPVRNGASRWFTIRPAAGVRSTEEGSGFAAALTNVFSKAGGEGFHSTLNPKEYNLIKDKFPLHLKTLLDFLVMSVAGGESAVLIGIPVGRQKSVSSRNERLVCDLASIQRTAQVCAINDSKAKNITGAAQAISKRMASLFTLRRNVHLAVGALARRKEVMIPDLLEVIQATVASLAVQYKNKHEAPISHEELSTTFGVRGSGGTLAFLHEVAETLAAKYGTSISARTVRDKLSLINVKLIKAKNDVSITNVSQGHAAWEVKVARRLHYLFPSLVISLAMDATARRRINDDSFNEGRGVYHVMDEGPESVTARLR
jgi:hypothetical protein